MLTPRRPAGIVEAAEAGAEEEDSEAGMVEAEEDLGLASIQGEVPDQEGDFQQVLSDPDPSAVDFLSAATEEPPHRWFAQCRPRGHL